MQLFTIWIKFNNVNTFEFHTGSFMISDTVAPKMSRPPLSLRVTEGGTAVLECKFIASPYPITVVTWRREDQSLNVRIYFIY